jgi:hypothetical protein
MTRMIPYCYVSCKEAAGAQKRENGVASENTRKLATRFPLNPIAAALKIESVLARLRHPDHGSRRKGHWPFTSSFSLRLPKEWCNRPGVHLAGNARCIVLNQPCRHSAPKDGMPTSPQRIASGRLPSHSKCKTRRSVERHKMPASPAHLAMYRFRKALNSLACSGSFLPLWLIS